MPAATSSTGRILLVDDDPLVCDSVRRMLEFDQRKVQIATSAKEALALCEKDTFDLVILDYLMPEMKGDELALVIKERFPNQSIIMITADAERVGTPDDKPPGVDWMVGKPFRLDEIREAVAKALRKE